jgi:L-lactate dehydrogenase complex protein LldG
MVEAAAQLQTRLATQRPALIAQVQQELDAVGGAVAHVHSAPEAVAYITHLAQQKDAHLVVRWQSELLEALEVDAALHQQGVTVHTTAFPPGIAAEDATNTVALTTRRQELRALLARADLGLSGVDYVIAETGTLVLMARAGQMRGVSLLPPVHVAVARTSQVIATLADYLLLVQAAGVDPQQYLTSCVSFVTGPSRTGDIELKLTVGVHGPGELHLVLLDEPGASRTADA